MDKRALLEELEARVAGCSRCALAGARTNPVFGCGSPDAAMIFVGEAPGYHEDQQGTPFVGQAGQLLEKLLARIGLSRDEVFIANVLKCRPPDNRDPLVEEIDMCRTYLEEQIAVIAPQIICTMGNFATKLISGKPDGISRVHGKLQSLPGHESVGLFPVFHPAAALYTPSNLKLLEADFDMLATLIKPKKAEVEVEVHAPGAGVELEQPEGHSEPEQLDLF